MNKSIHDRVLVHPFCTGMKPEHLKTVAASATEATFKAGEIIFSENEPANRFYLIESGKVVLDAHAPGNGSVPIQTLKAGDVLGWSWLYPPFVWHFRATAAEPTSVIIVDGAHLLIAAEKNHSFGFELMRRLSQVVIQRLQATRGQLLQQLIESAYDG